jgi:hypothetical protein
VTSYSSAPSREETLTLEPFVRLAQAEEPGSAGREARSGRGLGMKICIYCGNEKPDNKFSNDTFGQTRWAATICRLCGGPTMFVQTATKCRGYMSMALS